MLKCRLLSKRAGTLVRAGKKRAFASGSEAVAAATLADARPDDSLISTAPDVCAALLKGVPLASLLRRFSGRSSAAKLRDSVGQVHFASGVVAGPFAGPPVCNFAAVALAAGCAFEARHSNRKSVAIAFYRGANTDLSLHEVLHFVLAHNLPVVMVRQSSRPLDVVLLRGRSGKGMRRSLPTIPVDANDAVAVYRVAHEAIAHARRGSGPTLIDCVPLRLPGERKRDSDCIVRMERYLESKGLRPGRIRADVVKKFTLALDAAVAAARKTPETWQY